MCRAAFEFSLGVFGFLKGKTPALGYHKLGQEEGVAKESQERAPKLGAQRAEFWSCIGQVVLLQCLHLSNDMIEVDDC